MMGRSGRLGRGIEMTKGELIEHIARAPNMNLKRAEVVVNAVFRAMGEALARGDRVEVRGFGSFAVRTYPPHVGRNPKTGREVMVGEKKVPLFKAGKALRARINGEDEGGGAPGD